LHLAIAIDCPLAALQCLNACGAVYGSTVASSRIDISDDFAATLAFGIQKRVEDAWLADKL
jgi:hypothetical protein